MKKSVGIIGLGWVGASTAISILHKGICSDLLLFDVKEGLAEGEAMDLQHGSSFYPTCNVQAANSIKDMHQCDVIVITAGRGVKENETRLDVLKDNIGIVKSISEQLKGYKGILVIVANPVDVLTYYYQKFSGISPKRVIGTGTMLDTARLRDIIGRRLHINAHNIHAQVIGEHGDSEVILWSSIFVGGLRLRNWKGWDPAQEPGIEEEVRKAAHNVKIKKGVANHAIGLVGAELVQAIIRGENRVKNLSTVMDGMYGLKDIAISLPTMITENGVEEVLEVDFDEKEKTLFFESVEVIKEAIESCR